MAEDIWLSMDEVCNLTGEVKETVRRKCKRGEYSCNYSFEIPANINTTSIVYDLREFIPHEQNTNIFACKELLDYHIQAVINQRPHRNQLFKGKSPNELWQENYVQQELPNKKKSY